MTAIHSNIGQEVKTFIENHKVLSILTLGLAIVGYSVGKFASRAVSIITKCCGTVKKTQNVANRTLNAEKTEQSEIKIVPSENQNQTSLPKSIIEVINKSEVIQTKESSRSSQMQETQTAKSVNIAFYSVMIQGVKISFKRGDITQEEMPVLVNAANTGLWAGAGVCGAFRKMAGEHIFKECEEILQTNGIKQIQTSEAVMTTAGNIGNDKVVIHTAGPDFHDIKDDKERKKSLITAYINTLKLVLQYRANEENIKISQKLKTTSQIDLHSIAFPPLSMGIFAADFSKEEGAKCAMEAIADFLRENPQSGLKEIGFIFLPEDQDTDKLGILFSETFKAYQK